MLGNDEAHIECSSTPSRASGRPVTAVGHAFTNLRIHPPPVPFMIRINNSTHALGGLIMSMNIQRALVLMSMNTHLCQYSWYSWIMNRGPQSPILPVNVVKDVIFGSPWPVPEVHVGVEGIWRQKQ